MQCKNHRALLLGAAFLAAVSLGCGASGNVTVYPVKGKITFEGKPMVGGGSITFVPTGRQAGKTAGGEIKEDGTYVLTTYKPGDGSMVGEFRVIITQTLAKEPPPSKDGEPPPEATAAVAEADRIPLVYSDHHNSPLPAKVEAKSPNELNFDLTRQAAAPPQQTGAG